MIKTTDLIKAREYNAGEIPFKLDCGAVIILQSSMVGEMPRRCEPLEPRE